MNIFYFRNQIIEDYTGYVSSFISIAQPRLLASATPDVGSFTWGSGPPPHARPMVEGQ